MITNDAATDRVEAPSVEAIEHRLTSRVVCTARPALWCGIGALRFARRFGWSAEGADTLAKCDAPMILAANHASHADTAAILGTLPENVRARVCVAAALDVFGSVDQGQRGTAKSVRRELLQILVATGFHAFAFDRHGPPRQSLRTAGELVRRGWNLLLYPEGTRSRNGRLGRFKSGVGILARMTQRPVVPVHVQGGPSILPCGATMPRAGHALVRYGAPIRVGANESAQTFTARLKDRIGELGCVTSVTAPATTPAAIEVRTAALAPRVRSDTDRAVSI